ncbi:hypothetical protein D3C78_1158920 [compost metagenome]
MDDVFGQVLLAAGDENLAAGDSVAAVGLRFGSGADEAEVGAGVRFGQAHGARPAALIHGWQVGLLELGAGVSVDGQAGAATQDRIQGEAGVRGVEHFFDVHGKHLGHAHAAKNRVAGKADPATFGVSGVGLLESAWRGHHAVAPARAFLIATAVQRRQGFAGELAGFFQDGAGGVHVEAVGEVGQGRPLCPGIEDIAQEEVDIAQGRLVTGHGRISEVGMGWAAISRRMRISLRCRSSSG